MSTLSETVSILVSMDAKRSSTVLSNLSNFKDSSVIAFNRSWNSRIVEEMGVALIDMSSDETCKWGFFLREEVGGGKVLIIVLPLRWKVSGQ